MTPALNTSKITSLKRVMDEIKEIRSNINELSEPTITDWGFLPTLYQIFQDLFSRRPIVQKIYHRQKFLFVALYLFHPLSLTGERMPPGFRKALAATLKINATTVVSDNCAGLMVLYRNYVDFRKDTEIFYEKVMEFLESAHAE